MTNSDSYGHASSNKTLHAMICSRLLWNMRIANYHLRQKEKKMNSYRKINCKSCCSWIDQLKVIWCTNLCSWKNELIRTNHYILPQCSQIASSLQFTHTTPASSVLWMQLCTPHPAKLHWSKASSDPEQCRLSIQNGTELTADPKRLVVTAHAASSYPNILPKNYFFTGIITALLYSFYLTV